MSPLQEHILDILYPDTRYRERIHCISRFFIMRFTANSLTDKDDQSGYCYDNDILYRMTFLLSTVFLFLFIIVYRMGNLSFSAVMKQYRPAFLFGKLCQTGRKFGVCLHRDKSHYFKTQPKNVCQTVDKNAAILPVHSEADGMILLQRIILQINKDEEKTLGNIRQRAVLINAMSKTTTSMKP